MARSVAQPAQPAVAVLARGLTGFAPAGTDEFTVAVHLGQSHSDRMGSMPRTGTQGCTTPDRVVSTQLGWMYVQLSASSTLNPSMVSTPPNPPQ